MSKGDPNDILYLMLINGAILKSVPCKDADLVRVTTWKGQTPKEQMRKRILGDAEFNIQPKLSPAELRILGDNPNHNVLDAVGIGLWVLKRL